LTPQCISFCRFGAAVCSGGSAAAAKAQGACVDFVVASGSGLV
jgi:hypothetical protein